MAAPSTAANVKKDGSLNGKGSPDDPGKKPAEQKPSRLVIRGGKAPEIPLYERKNWLIHLCYIRKDYNNCKELIKELLAESNGQCEYAIYIKGLILRDEGSLKESLQYFQQAVSLNPNNPANIKQVGRSLFLLGSYKASLDAYSEAEKLDRDWEVLHNKGICYTHLKQHNEAIECLMQAIQISPQIDSYKELGRVYLTLGNIPKAAETYRKAVKQNPEDSDLLACLGILYLQIGSSQKAFDCLGSSLTFDPTNYKAILAAGSIIQSHADYDVALSKYRIAAQSSPESPHLWNNIGMCFYGKSKFVAAISCLKHATYLAPFEWKILYNLGLVHLAMTQYASAFHFLRAAQRQQPKDPHILMLLGVSLSHLNDIENSLRAYEQAVETNTKDPLIYLNYAIALYNIDKKTAAANQFKTFQTKLRSTSSDRHIDPEIQEVSSKLGAVLQIGDVKVGGGSRKGSLKGNKQPTTIQEEESEEERGHGKIVGQEEDTEDKTMKK